MEEFFQKIVNFFDGIWTYLTVDLWAGIVVWYETAVYKLKIVAMEMAEAGLTSAWNFVSPLFDGSSSIQQLETLWAGFGADVINILTILRVPESLLLILGAWVTRFIIRLVLPGI